MDKPGHGLDEKDLLIRIAQQQDKQAFRQLVELYSPPLRIYTLTFVKKNELAEEVVSDVWVKIWRNRTQLERIEHLSGYLYTATRNQALTYQQRLAKQPFVDIDPAELFEYAEPDTPLKTLEAKELFTIADQAIAQLPEGCRTAFRLVRETNLTYQEAADEMRISVNTLKTHLRRAINKLRVHVKNHLSDTTSV